MTTAQFKRDLERGKAGEQFLKSQYPKRPDEFPEPPYLWEPANPAERRWDLELVSARDGKCLQTVEVKTDSYDPEQTPNFFMELLTVVGGRELVGGPWRARADGVDTFVYLYHGRAKPSRAFWFYDLPALVRELDTRPSRFQMRSVKLDQLRATGLLVPRSALAHLYTEHVYEER